MATGSTVLIELITPAGAVTNITSRCLFNRCSFDMQANGQPGTFQVTVTDTDQTGEYPPGLRIRLTIDGTVMYGGYVTQVSKTFLTPASDTSDIVGVQTRAWVLRGADYNILFDKRVLRANDGNYTSQLPKFRGDRTDGSLIREMCEKYLDLPVGFDYTTGVQDIGCVLYNLSTQVDENGISVPFCDGTKSFDWQQQGSLMRSQIAEFALINRAIYYIDPGMVLRYIPFEEAEMPWGFSDIPNGRTITGTSGFSESGGALIGFRDLDWNEDGSTIVNDVLMWGGRALTSDTILFTRRQNAETIAKYGRWQYAENGIEKENYGTQANLNLRAYRIVDGITGTEEGMQRGLKVPQQTVTLTWFAHEVPAYDGVRQHVKAGWFTNFHLYTFGETVNQNGLVVRKPRIITLPVRSISISFPALDATGNGYVQFTGNFGIQTSDSSSLWAFLDERAQPMIGSSTITVADDSSETTAYGAYGRFTPTPNPDGTTTDFAVKFGYISGTLQVYVNGLSQMPGSQAVELEPENGTFRLTLPPQTGDQMLVVCRTLSE